MELQTDPKWRAPPPAGLTKGQARSWGMIPKCRFSQTWVRKFFQVSRMTRRRITATTELPSEAAAGAMTGVQDFLDAMKVSLDYIINMDETALLYGDGPTHQYTTRGQRRGRSKQRAIMRL